MENSGKLITSARLNHSVYLLLFFTYLLVVPGLIFGLIYFNSFGIPNLPNWLEIMFFSGRIILGSFENIFLPFSLPIILFFFLRKIGQVDFLKSKFDWMFGYLSWLKLEEKYIELIKANANWVFALGITFLIARTGYLESLNPSFLGLLFLSLVLGFPFITILVTNYILPTSSDYEEKITEEDLNSNNHKRVIEKTKRLSLVIDKDKKNLSVLFVIPIFVILTGIGAKSFIKEVMYFPQVESRHLRIWIDEKFEYSMSCNKDMGTVLVKASLLNELNTGNKQMEDGNGHQISVVDYNFAKSICARAFN